MKRTLFAVVPAAVLSLFAPPALAQGLEPPGPVNTGAPVTTPSEPASDESQDSGLGLEWVWLNADVGVGYVNMESFSSSSLALQKSSSVGPAFGVGAGVRLLFLTLGVRAQDLQLSAFNLWELSAEAALHMRIWRIDPYFGVRGGYAFVGSLSSDAVQNATANAPPEVSVHGFDVGPTFGLDVYLSSLVSIGGDANAQILFLQRPIPPIPRIPTVPGETPQQQQQAQDQFNAQVKSQPLYSQAGSSVGLGLSATAHLGIHF